MFLRLCNLKHIREAKIWWVVESQTVPRHIADKKERTEQAFAAGSELPDVPHSDY